VLTHHALEGYTNCALTRIQIFGSTLLQSLDKIQNMNSTTGSSSTANRDPAFVKAPIDKLYNLMNVVEPDIVPNIPVVAPPTVAPTTSLPPQQPVAKDESNNPLLAFVEEMTQLKSQYAAMSHNLYAMNEALKSQSALNQTVVPLAPGTITVSILGTSFVVSRNWDAMKLLVIVLVLVQCMTMYMVFSRKTKNNEHVRSAQIVHRSGLANSSDSENDSRDASRMKLGKPFVTPMKKRHHGIWKPRIRRSVFYHYMGIPNKSDDVVKTEDETTRVHGTITGTVDMSAPRDVLN